MSERQIRCGNCGTLNAGSATFCVSCDALLAAHASALPPTPGPDGPAEGGDSGGNTPESTQPMPPPRPSATRSAPSGPGSIGVPNRPELPPRPSFTPLYVPTTPPPLAPTTSLPKPSESERCQAPDAEVSPVFVSEVASESQLSTTGPDAPRDIPEALVDDSDLASSQERVGSAASVPTGEPEAASVDAVEAEDRPADREATAPTPSAGEPVPTGPVWADRNVNPFDSNAIHRPIVVPPEPGARPIVPPASWSNPTTGGRIDQYPRRRREGFSGNPAGMLWTGIVLFVMFCIFSAAPGQMFGVSVCFGPVGIFLIFWGIIVLVSRQTNRRVD